MKVYGTRSYIIVEYDHRAIKISGELTTEPAFYADISSISNWEPPYESIIVTEEEKQDLIKKVVEVTKSHEVRVYFD